MSSQTQETQNPTSSRLKADKSKFMIFRLGPRYFGLALSSVKEVIQIPDITATPSKIQDFRGLINLRGQIVGVIDLKRKFKIQDKDDKSKYASLVISIIGSTSIATPVDEVCEVLNLEDHQTEFRDQKDAAKDGITGVAKTEGRLIQIIDITKLIGKDFQPSQAA